MTRYLYNREVAVKEGYRSSTEINKDSFKRPVAQWNKNKLNPNASKYIENRKYLLNHITRLKEENIIKTDCEGEFSKSNFGSSRFREDRPMVNKSKVIRKIDEIYNLENKVNLKELIKLSDTEKRSICCYVEKQHGYIYTLRDLATINKDEVYEVKLDGLYDVVAKAVYINLSKKNGDYKVNKIQSKTSGKMIKN